MSEKKECGLLKGSQECCKRYNECYDGRCMECDAEDVANADLQRCNNCDAVFDEELTSCPNCGRDDCLMYPF